MLRRGQTSTVNIYDTTLIMYSNRIEDSINQIAMMYITSSINYQCIILHLTHFQLIALVYSIMTQLTQSFLVALFGVLYLLSLLSVVVPDCCQSLNNITYKLRAMIMIKLKKK